MISILVFLIIVGVILYLVNNVVPMVAWMKTVINCLAIVFVLFYLLNAFGLYHLPHLPLRVE